MKNKIAGLHLWCVELSNTSTKLWITTRRNNLLYALTKAQRFLRKGNRRFRGNTVVGATNEGTLDA